MKFELTKLDGVFLVSLEKHFDERGFFSRIFDNKIFQKNELCYNFLQWSISHNETKGTLRGMHFQDIPYEEEKIVMCTKGQIFDVLIDIRKNSKTFGQWCSFTLDETMDNFLYIPKGIAHGFQTMEDNTDIFYAISQKYKPEYAKGIRWNDKHFDIPWPIIPPVNISVKDNSYDDFSNLF